MAKCAQCGRRGLFLKVNSFGRCAECEAQWQAKQEEVRRQQELRVSQSREAEKRQKKEEAAKPVASVDTIYRSHSDSVTTSYRSPLAAARRGLFYCEGEPNLYNVSDEEYRLAIFLMYFAGWQVMNENRGSYDMQQLFPRPLEEFNALLQHGWIAPPNPESSLSRMTVSELKAFASEQGISVKGAKKADLLKSLLDSAPAAVLSEYAAAHWYADLTPQGYSVLRSLYNERIEIILRVSRLLLAKEKKAAELAAAAYWHKRSILTHPSIVLDIPEGIVLTHVEACTLAAKAYFMNDNLIKVFIDYWGEHDGVVMHRGIAEFLFHELLVAKHHIPTIIAKAGPNGEAVLPKEEAEGWDY